MVDLTTIHGPNYLVLPAKARREFLSAVEEAANMEFSNPAERRSVTQLAMKLHQLWGKITSAYRSLRFINMVNESKVVDFVRWSLIFTISEMKS